MSEQNTVEVETAHGRVSGLMGDGSTRFLGIPYAAAPAGDLLFAAPVAPKRWPGVRAAHTLGATAPKPPLGGRFEVPPLLGRC
ncbi:carboxylesterase family protein [Streptomyces sp. NPDC006692]|uniref:carboxylesterase family protein n=1 Tax=Streptomyces sp. NPDC006692 TaxID=3364758 RepID=UPI0036AD494C